ncbi:sialidase family protein [Pedobacter sp. Du54]|uniref:sialidase family protein n=1 Tax=Pedobacter anseongensis TaxID=3133439 RepID=UPI0030989A89
MKFNTVWQKKLWTVYLLQLSAISCSLCLSCSSSKKIDHENKPFITQVRVFPFSAENKPNYRIPAMVSTPNGDLLIFAEKRRKSVADVGYTDIIMTRSSDKGKTWASERILFGGNNESNADPTTLVDTVDKKIYLFFLRDKKQFYMMFTTDNGKSWSTPKSIHHEIIKPEWDGYKGSINTVNSPADSINKSTDWKKNWQQSYGIGPGNAGIRLSKVKPGRLLIPIRRKDATHVVYSDDDGHSWHTGPVVAERASEAQLIELENGNVMVNCRNGDHSDSTNIKRIVNISADGGETWGKSYIDPNLEETSCNASIIRLSSVQGAVKNRILFSNPKNKVRTVKHPYGRINMSVRLSYDEGKSWPISKTIYPYASSYSSLAVLNDQTIGIVYERGKDATTPYYWDELWFARFNLEWLTEGKDSIKKNK